MINNLNITPEKPYFNKHYFCDYIELVSLVSNPCFLSKSDILERFYQDEKNVTSGTIDNGNQDDKWESRVSDWFLMLDSRKNEFKDFYPFNINDNKISLKNNLNREHKAYIFLLLNSTQKYLNNTNNLTSDFELMSLEVLRKYLPKNSRSYKFGKSGVNNSRYKGCIETKIDLLAQDLQCKTNYEPYYFSSHDNGDGGLDLVAWTVFTPDDTNQNNIQIYLGQCATGKEWLSKQDDTEKFESKYIDFQSNINYMMFIPYDGRNLDRTFNEAGRMGKYLLFDRLRMLFLFDCNLTNNMPSFSVDSIIEATIQYQENIV
ncbi:MAG: hypothetical protein FE834_09350 [Gammaproteobacteria bacterium]|nr:hypothetical protein [Gammaproteobacteria bacterium]